MDFYWKPNQTSNISPMPLIAAANINAVAAELLLINLLESQSWPTYEKFPFNLCSASTFIEISASELSTFSLIPSLAASRQSFRLHFPHDFIRCLTLGSIDLWITNSFRFLKQNVYDYILLFTDPTNILIRVVEC